MPVTFPSHQGIIVGAKLRWPSRIDGTALCIGAATPDLAYALTRWLAVQSHTWVGVLVWATPVAIVAATLVRWRAAAGIFAQLPDCGPLQLRSYRVLGRRSPHIVSTVLSAFAGSASHSFVDAFTHEFRWGANWLGLNDVVLTLPIKGPMTGAGILQYVGHSLGSLAFVVALFFMASTGKLVAWYGESNVADARDIDVSLTSRLVFWSVTVGPIVAAILLAPSLNRSPLFSAVTASFVGILAAGSLVGKPDRNRSVND